MNLGWNFPSNNNGTILGIGEAGIETFKGNLLGSLAREICQNSLDACLDHSKPVRVEFSLNSVKKEKIPDIDYLHKVINLCKSYWDNSKTNIFCDRAIEICSRDFIDVMRISDYNTTGLTGSDKVKESTWQDLVKSSGVSNKSGKAGGSFGIGKSAPFACSELRTVFYSTFDKNSLKAYQGVSKLVSFENFDKSYITQGTGYYGRISDNSAVNDLFSVDEYVRNEFGTDLYILGFIKENNWIEEITKSIIENYLISILENHLEVIIHDIVISKEKIHNLMENYKEKIPLTYNYYQVLTDSESKCIKKDFQNLGELELKLLIKKDFRRKVLIARDNGMKIFDKANISSSIPFSGVCILRAQSINEFFREMENPQHNNWEEDRHSNKTKAKKRKKELFSFIKEEILKIGNETISDEMDAIGIGEFIPDNIETKTDNNSESENINDNIKSYTSLEKHTELKIEKNKNLSDNKENFTSETDESGEISDNSDFLSPNYYYEDGIIKNKNFFDNENFIEDDYLDENMKLKKNFENVTPLKLRLFLYDMENNIYKLSFTSVETTKNTYIKISASGEQNNTHVILEKAENEKKEPLKFRKNSIFIGDITKGNKYHIFYKIKSNEIYSMEVAIYGHKI